MGPDADCLALAVWIKKEFPSITENEYRLAYSIQAWCEENEPPQDAQP
jgi:hypothetical protein